MVVHTRHAFEIKTKPGKKWPKKTKSNTQGLSKSCLQQRKSPLLLQLRWFKRTMKIKMTSEKSSAFMVKVSSTTNFDQKLTRQMFYMRFKKTLLKFERNFLWSLKCDTSSNRAFPSVEIWSTPPLLPSLPATSTNIQPPPLKKKLIHSRRRRRAGGVKRQKKLW